MSTVITLPLYKHGLEHGVQVAGRTLADLSTGTRACMDGRGTLKEGETPGHEKAGQAAGRGRIQNTRRLLALHNSTLARATKNKTLPR